MNKSGRNRGFTLVEIMIVVLIIGILMAIAVPNFIRARESSRRNACVTNLKKMDGAKEQWAMDNRAAAGAAVTMADIATTYLKCPVTGPECPAGGTYTVDNVGVNPSCSLSAAPELHVIP